MSKTPENTNPSSVTHPAPDAPTQAPAAPAGQDSPVSSISNPAQPANLPMEVASAGTPNSQPAPEQNLNFSTENIGQWAAKQESPFAAQNRKTSEKKKARAKRTPIIILGVIAGLLLVGGIITLIIVLVQSSGKVEPPEIYGSSSTDIYDYQDALSQIYRDSDENLDAVADAVDGTLSTEAGKANEAQVRIAEAYFYGENGDFQRAIDALGDVDPSQLSIEQQVMYYDTLYYSNTILGNDELADEYFQKSYELRVELGGEGG